jgi:inner membrane protein
MRWGTHLAFGAACYTAATWAAGEAPTVPGALLALAGSLLPDIDHPHSFVGRRLPFISVPLSRAIGHRGFTHSCLAAVLFVVTILALARGGMNGVSALGIGYLSHLLGDWLTPSGIPFMWPSRRKYVSPATFFTGGPAEKTFAGVLVVLLLWAYGVLPLNQLAGFK